MGYLAHISEDGTEEQLLKEHLQGTAKLAERFAAEFGCGSWGYSCGLMHDIGKYSREFQRRVRGEELRTDHSTAGAIEMKRIGAFPAAYCVAGHHAGLPDGGSPADDAGSPSLQGRLKKKVADYSSFREEIQPPRLGAPKLTPQGRGFFSPAFFIRMLFSCLVDADFLNTEVFMRGQERQQPGLDMEILRERLMQYVGEWLKAAPENTSLNGKRTHILRDCLERGKGERGVYQLTVPTGGGKTISSMAFALEHAVRHGLKRIIYVIPYTSIIEQNAQVFRKILGEDQVLENHSNVEYDSDDFDPMQLAAENWDRPVVVTTNVQFFESLYAVKSSRCRKLHNLANSVLIFDEAQMLPVEYLLPCVKAVTELILNYGCTAVLCTATQPSLEEMFPKSLYQGEISPYASVSFEDFRRNRMEMIGELREEELAERLLEQRQVLCILNTRGQVKSVYGRLSKEEGTFHLSTYMYPEHRRKVLDKIRKRLQNGQVCRVISTCLVEAGVDLDFGMVYRELSGLDSIIQAAGRCNREGKKDRDESRVCIFTFVKEERHRNDMLRQAIRISEQILEEYRDFASPEAIQDYFQRMHKLAGDGLDLYRVVARLDEARADSIPFASVASDVRIIRENTRTIFITDAPEAKALERQLRYGERTRGLMRRVGKYCVNVYEDTYERLLAAGKLEELDEQITLLRDPAQYSEQEGLIIDVERGDAIFF
ncbi:MAG: CRISPR-associated helicase Cas3' [Eubacteriales bacterium]|nr:CRISPR-associated helicase Cas3' [Eubacteriales bacterium]